MGPRNPPSPSFLKIYGNHKHEILTSFLTVKLARLKTITIKVLVTAQKKKKKKKKFTIGVDARIKMEWKKISFPRWLALIFYDI